MPSPSFYLQNGTKAVTDNEILQVYLTHIERWFGIKSTRQIAEELDLSEAQIESIVDDISWPKFKIAQDIPRANKENHICQVIPFRGRLTNND